MHHMVEKSHGWVGWELTDSQKDLCAKLSTLSCRQAHVH